MPWNRGDAVITGRSVSRVISGVKVTVFRRSAMDAVDLVESFAPLAGLLSAIAQGDAAAAAKFPRGKLREIISQTMSPGVKLDGHDANSPEGQLLLEEATAMELLKVVLFVVEVHRDPLAATKGGVGLWKKLLDNFLAELAKKTPLFSGVSGAPSPSTSDATGSPGASSPAAESTSPQ